jgi:hypothetical protein
MKTGFGIFIRLLPRMKMVEKTFAGIGEFGEGIHPDHHAFWIDPDDSNYLIEGNDGGLNISRDGGR